MALSAPPDEGLARTIFETIGGGILGAVVTLVTFRTRLSLMDRAIKAHDVRFTDMANDHTVELTRLRAEIEQRHRENQDRADQDRRMARFTLRLVADVARKLEVDKRVDDVVIEFLTGDSVEEP